MITGELVLSQMLAWWPLKVGSLHGAIDTSLQVRHYDNRHERTVLAKEESGFWIYSAKRPHPKIFLHGFVANFPERFGVSSIS
jgi:hypothetical protein